MTLADLDKYVKFFDGKDQAVSKLLRDDLVLQLVHHRGQRSVLVRMVSGRIPPLFGPTRESRRAVKSYARLESLWVNL